jgi:hypothetical protein
MDIGMLGNVNVTFAIQRILPWTVQIQLQLRWFMSSMWHYQKKQVWKCVPSRIRTLLPNVHPLTEQHFRRAFTSKRNLLFYSHQTVKAHTKSFLCQLWILLRICLGEKNVNTTQGAWSASSPGHLLSGRANGEETVRPRTVLDVVEKKEILPLWNFEHLFLGGPGRSLVTILYRSINILTYLAIMTALLGHLAGLCCFFVKVFLPRHISHFFKFDCKMRFVIIPVCIRSALFALHSNNVFNYI